MAVVAVKTIVSSEDRIVLEQQYKTIIDRLKFGNINDDAELKDFHDDLLAGITNSLLAQDERRRFEQVYDREQKRAVLSALKGTLTALPLPGELPWLALGRTLMRGVTAFFGYQAAKKRLSEDLSDDLWRLEREKVRGVDELQRSLLRTTWSLLRKYGFSDDERVTQEDLDELEKAIQQPDPARARRMFADLAGKFKTYPPFWFYYGEAALQSGDVQTAEACFDSFDKTNRDVLRKDPYCIQIAKYRLMITKNPTRDFVRDQLAVVAEDDTQWLNNLYRGVLLFAIGDRDEGIRAVEHNVDFDYEREISSLVLKAMKQGTQHLWAALARAFYDGKGVESDKVAAYKYAWLAHLYGDTSVNDLIETIEGTRRWFGPKAQINRTEQDVARAEAQRLFDRERTQVLAVEKAKQLLAEQLAERERAEKEAAERVRKETEERAAKEAAERARKESEERAAKEVIERARKEAEERERAEKEAAERARKEAEERAAEEAAERARKAAEEQKRMPCSKKDKQLNTTETALGAILLARTALPLPKIGDIVTFGRYLQDNSAEKTPIEWSVCAECDDSYLLISKYGLDSQRYHNCSTENMTWKNSSLRKWLNEQFMNDAFIAEEQSVIKSVNNDNPLNQRYRISGGGATIDNIFLLSIEQASRLFASNEDRLCRPTIFAKFRGATVSRGYGWCWLRSIGGESTLAANTYATGAIHYYGYRVDRDGGCVRPALWVSKRYWEQERVPLSQKEVNAEVKHMYLGATVRLGSYEQGKRGKVALKWLVVAHEQDRYLLLSKNGVDCKQYHKTSSNVTWENCNLRNWLNGEFMKSAFDVAEQRKIQLTHNLNPNNAKFGTIGGNSTDDKVFLLSIDEVQRYLNNIALRQCALTDYTKEQGAYIDNNKVWWWLRSPGYSSLDAAIVQCDGSISAGGSTVVSNYGCVRPALWVSSLDL